MHNLLVSDFERFYVEQNISGLDRDVIYPSRKWQHQVDMHEKCLNGTTNCSSCDGLLRADRYTIIIG